MIRQWKRFRRLLGGAESEVANNAGRSIAPSNRRKPLTGARNTVYLFMVTPLSVTLFRVTLFSVTLFRPAFSRALTAAFLTGSPPHT